MILTCPSCSASYNVPAEAIGPKGREVRCKKCAHVWFQAGEKKALDDILNRLQSSDFQEDDISFADRKKEKRPKIVRAPFFKPLIAKVKIRVSTFVSAKILKGRTISIPVTSRDVAGVSVSLAVVSVVMLGVVVGRWSIVSAFPSMEGVYKAAGFSVVSYANVNPEEALVIEHPALEKTKDGRVIHGNIINLTSSDVLLPKIQASFIDKHGQKLAEEVHSLPFEILRKEASLSLKFPVPEKVPDRVATIELRFVDK